VTVRFPSVGHSPPALPGCGRLLMGGEDLRLFALRALDVWLELEGTRRRAMEHRNGVRVIKLAARRAGCGLRVGLIAPPWVPVPPPLYGGTELVVDQLARGLRRAGCEVVLFTTGDATCAVDRRWLYAKALGTTADLSTELAHIELAYREFADMD